MNFLVLMSDHHRFDAFGRYPNPVVKTPNLDQLDERGVRFENCYCQSPVCSPARHSLATGRYTHAHGVIHNTVPAYPDIHTIAHALKPAGYRCFQTGFMMWDPRIPDTGYEPETIFDRTTNGMPDGPFKDLFPPRARERYDAESFCGPMRRSTGGPTSRDKTQFSGHFVAEQSIRKIEEAVSKGEQFLSWTSFFEPHPPYYAPTDYYRLYDPSKIELPELPPSNAPAPHRRVQQLQSEWSHLTDYEARQIIAAYFALCTLVDEYTGSVIAALDRLGVRDETAIIWTADHGDQLWEHRMFLKFQMREASVHVPLIMDVPGVEPGRRSELVEHVDLFPTICQLAGVQISPSSQGRSLFPLLQNASDEWRLKEAVHSQIGPMQMYRTDRWKLNVFEDGPGELYNLAEDPKEFTNLIDDPAHATQVQQLESARSDWYKRMAHPAEKNR